MDKYIVTLTILQTNYGMYLSMCECCTLSLISLEAGSTKHSRKKKLSFSDESDSDEDVYYKFVPNQGIAS